MFCGLIGPIYVERQVAGVVETKHRYAMLLQTLRAGFRAGHGAVDFALYPRQGIDEVIGGRAGTDTHYHA